MPAFGIHNNFLVTLIMMAEDEAEGTRLNPGVFRIQHGAGSLPCPRFIPSRGGLIWRTGASPGSPDIPRARPPPSLFD